jgi:hypothetical protein
VSTIPNVKNSVASLRWNWSPNTPIHLSVSTRADAEFITPAGGSLNAVSRQRPRQPGFSASLRDLQWPLRPAFTHSLTGELFKMMPGFNMVQVLCRGDAVLMIAQPGSGVPANLGISACH